MRILFSEHLQIIISLWDYQGLNYPQHSFPNKQSWNLNDAYRQPTQSIQKHSRMWWPHQGTASGRSRVNTKLWFQRCIIFHLCFYHNTCHMLFFLYQDFWILPNTKPIHEKEWEVKTSFHDMVCHICSTFGNALEITKVFSWSKSKFAYLSRLIYLTKQHHKSSPRFNLWFYNLFSSNLPSTVPKSLGWLFSFNLKTSLSFCYSHIDKGMPWELPRIYFSHCPSIGLNFFWGKLALMTKLRVLSQNSSTWCSPYTRPSSPASILNILAAGGIECFTVQ